MTLCAKRHPASVPLSTLPDVTRTHLSGPLGEASGGIIMTGPLLPQAGRIQTAGLQEFHLGTPETQDRRFLGLRSGVLMFFFSFIGLVSMKVLIATLAVNS